MKNSKIRSWREQGSAAIIALELLGIVGFVIISSYYITDWQIKSEDEKQQQTQEVVNQALSDIQEGNLSPKAITIDKLSDKVFLTGQTTEGTISSAELSDAILTVGSLDQNVFSIIYPDGTKARITIGTGKIKDFHLSDGSVTTLKILDSAVTIAKLADGSITTVKILDGAITSGKIADGTIIAQDLATGSVIEATIADGAVTNSKLADDSVTTSKIADGSIITSKISNFSITAAKIATGTITGTQVASDGTLIKSLSAGSGITVTNNNDGTWTITDSSGGLGDVVIAPTSAQADTTTRSTINLNKTGGSGDLLQLAVGGSDKFVVDYSGLISTPSVNSTSIVDGSIINADINNSAGLVYSKLNLQNSILNADVNSSAAITYTKLNLTGNILNADINTSAGIVYSKLNLASSIVNADVGATAAIAYSKLNLASSIINVDVSNTAAIAYSKLNLAGQIIGTDLASNIAITTSGTVNFTGAFQLNSVAVTANALELNILDGATLTTSELNVLDGITANTAELNILDGATLTTAELNILDDATITTTELNLLAGLTGTIWTSTNDGAGSGLDADLLDGQHGAYYAIDANVVHDTGDEVIAGIKTFSSFPLTPSSAPTTDYQVANKKYVDDSIAVENLWDRTGTTLSPHTANDNVDLGLGDFITTGTYNNLTLNSNADGFAVAGGTTSRTLTITSANVTINQSLQTTDSPTFNALNLSTSQGVTGLTTVSSPTFTGLIVDTDTIYVDSVTHRLGVNTTSPDASLHVVGNILAEGNIMPEMTGATGVVSTRTIGDATNWFSKLWTNELYLGPSSLYVNDKLVISDVANIMNFTTDTDQGMIIKTVGTGTLTLQSDTGLLGLYADDEINANAKGGIELTVPADNAAKHLNLSNASANGNITLIATGTNSQVQLSAVDEIDLTAPTVDLNGNLSVSGNITDATWAGVAIANNSITDTLTGKTYNGLSITTDTNTFNLTRGTASLDVAAGKTVNIDTSLTVNTTDVTLNQSLQTSDSPTFTGLSNSDANITNVGDIALDTISSDNGTSIGLGVDASTAAINIGTAGVRTITIGNDASTKVDLNALAIELDSAGTIAMDSTTSTAISATTTIDLQATTGLTIDSAGATTIGIGTDANTGAINIGTSATARTMTIGNASSTEVELNGVLIDVNAGSNGFDLDSSSQINIDSSQASATAINISASSLTGGINIDSYAGVTINSWSGAISIGNDSDAYNINIGTGVATRTISVGNTYAYINLDGTTISLDSTSTANFSMAANSDADKTLTFAASNSGTGVGNLILSADGSLTVDSAGVLELNSSAGVISIGNDAITQNINLGTGAAARTITIGNVTNTTQLDFNTGTGGINLGDVAITKTIDIGGITNSAADTINIATNSTAADVIAIGNANASTTLAVTGGTAWSVGTTGIITTTGLANLNGGIAVDTDNFTVSGTTGAVGLVAGITTGNAASTGFDSATQTGALSGAVIDFTNITNNNANNLYGLDIKQFTLGAGAGGNLYGAYIEGTNWDYGLYVDDAAYFGGNVTINGLSGAVQATTGVLSAGTLPVGSGGTGQTSYTDGQLLIGNTTGNTLVKATLTGTANQIIVTNGAGTITLSTPQDIGIASSPTFASPTVTNLHVIDSGTTFDLIVASNSTADFDADHTMTIDLNNADRTFALQGNFTVESASIVNQDLSSDATPTFAGISSSAEINFTGAARHSRTLQLNAEYPGAVLSTFYGAGTDAVITGTMTSDTDTSGNLLRNYYEWNSGEAALNYYTVAVRITLPKDFSAWETSNAIQIDLVSESTNAANNLVSVYVYNSNDTPGTVVTSSTSNVSDVAATWKTINIDDSSLTSDPGWDTAGHTGVIYLRLGSKDNNYAHIGDIKLNYLSKW